MRCASDGRRCMLICVCDVSRCTLRVPISRHRAQCQGFQAPKQNQPSDPLTFLKSVDSREQAWGAWHAGQNRLYSAIPALEAVVSKPLIFFFFFFSFCFPPPLPPPPGAVALDALIQLDAQISPELIQLIYEWRPAQALILLSKNRGNVHQILLELMHRENGLRWFAAANMALERKSSGLGIALLKEMELAGTPSLLK